MNYSHGLKRAFLVFILVAIFLWMVFFALGNLGIELFGETILIIIGAGWSAYYIWKKTEYGRY